MKKLIFILILLYPAWVFAQGPAILPSDKAYDATTWNGSTLAPTQNAVRDKIVSMEASALTNPMDSAGDIIIGGASGVAAKLDSGTANYLLQANGAAAPTWVTDLTIGDITVGGGNINTGNIPLIIGDNTTDSITLRTDGGDVTVPEGTITLETTTSDINPDRLTGDTSDDDKIDQAIIAGYGASADPGILFADSTAPPATGTGDIKVDAYTAGQRSMLRVYTDEDDAEDVLYMTIGGTAAEEILFAKPIAYGADPADAGAIRLSNAQYVYSEADAAGTDISVIGVDSSEVVQIGASGASGVTITPATTFSAAVTVGSLLGVNSIDATGAVDMDYGSADVTDHTFVSDGGTAIIDGSITAADATNDNHIEITNNSGGRAPTASVYEIYPDAGIWKTNENGVEYTLVQSPYVGAAGTSAGEVLLSKTTVTFAADGDTALFTVPTSRRCVLTKAIVVAAADCGSTDLTIGANGAETDFLGTQQTDNLDAEYDAVILTPVPNATPVKQKSYAASTVIDMNVANHAGAAGNTVYLFGILY